MKHKQRRFFDRLKKKFQLSIFNESTLESMFSLRVSWLDGILLLLSVFVILFFLSFFLIRYTPVGAFMPPYMDVSVRNRLVEHAYKVDSLTNVISQQTVYIDVVKGIVAGNINVDSTDSEGHQIPIDTLANRHMVLMKATSQEEAFRKRYEEQEKYNLSTLNTSGNTNVLLFYPPVKGEVTSTFDPRLRQFGVDVKVNERQAVLAVLAGTVIYAGYDPDFRYVIQVQHADDYVSVYKYTTELLKKPGDLVKAGEALAMVGKVSGSPEQPHLYFELWQRGIAQNPVELVLF